jgi:DNA gyrase subunit A
MIINKSGIIIRMAVADLRIMGRATQGVRLIKIKEGDAIAAVTKVDVEEEGHDLEDLNGEIPAEGNEGDEGLDTIAQETEN